MILKRVGKLFQFYLDRTSFDIAIPVLSFFPNLVVKNKWTRAKTLPNEVTLYDEHKYKNTFGNIDDFESKFHRIKDDPEDIKEYERRKSAQGKSIAQYIKEIQTLLKNNDYTQALKIVEVDMVNDFKPAVSYIYDTLVSYNARQGNLSEAYRLYTKFKGKNGFVSGGMYTSLFNACANCKNSLLALEKAESIREFLNKDKHFKPNLTHYNAMLKAYGRHGDIVSCLKIMDEVLERRDKVRAITYGFLLQACISDKNSGLRHGLLVWRKMLQRGNKPTIFEFNNMLRCIRDCSFGDIELITDLIKEIQKESEIFFKKKVKLIRKDNDGKQKIVQKIPIDKETALGLLGINVESKVSHSVALSEIASSNAAECIESKEKSENTVSMQETNNNLLELQNKDLEVLQTESMINNSVDELPNLLAILPSVGSVIDFGSMTKPHERFLCFGELKGFIKTMMDYGVKPTIKTFTLFLDLVPSTIEAEERVIKEMHAHSVKPDTAFFNVLIKRRSCRTEPVTIKDSLRLMQEAEVTPDLITFGVLAIGCLTEEDAIELIEAARNCGIRLNSEILGALLQRASKISDFKYVNTILQAAKEDGTNLSPKFLVRLKRMVDREKRRRLTSIEESK